MVENDYWDLMMYTRDAKEGPDGIKLWNEITKKIANTEHAAIICRILLEHNVDWNRNMNQIIQNWQMCLRINNDRLIDAAEAFSFQVGKILRNADDSINSDQQRSKKLRRGTAKRGASPQNEKEKSKEREEGGQTEISNKYKDVDLRAKENEITRVRYYKDIGLVATAFKGTVKIFDAFNFHQIWKNSNKNRSDKYHTNIVTFDVSSHLGMMATGGAEGRLVLIDPYALGVINGVVAHKHKEIISVFCYDEQQQLITTAEDRTICLWDAYRLDRIQMIKDQSQSYIGKFSSSVFDKAEGMLYVGCHMITQYKALVDSKTEIEALQIETLSKA